MISLMVAGKREANGLFSAEVAISSYGDDSKVISSTRQRTVSGGFPSRKAAEAAAVCWVEDNLYLIVEKLPEAKP